MTTVFLPLEQRITHNLCSKTRNRQLRELRKKRLRVSIYGFRERVCTFRTSVSRAVATHIFYFFLLMDVRVPQRPAGRTLVALVFGCQLYLGGCVYSYWISQLCSVWRSSETAANVCGGMALQFCAAFSVAAMNLLTTIIID